MSLVTRLDQILYPRHSKNWDDQIFRARILDVLAVHPSSIVLDLGAGAGIVEQMNFRTKAKKICGVDPDPRVRSNPYLDEGRVGVGEAIPYEAASFDLVFADNVLEHLGEPAAVFGELFRVLKPGGLFLAKTPNKWHYMPTIARLTPHSFHAWVNKKRGRQEVDTFPTRYLANTPADIGRLAAASGMVVENIELIEGRPEYLRMTAVTYLAGWLYERVVNLVPWLSKYRILLVVSLRKPL